MIFNQATGIVARRWRPAPTRKEQQKWNRAAKAATGGSVWLIQINYISN